MTVLRLRVRVKPGASKPSVGGRYGEDALIVAVHAPPVDGAANDAVIRAVADALGVRPRQVSLVTGHTARTKVLAIDVPDEQAPRLQAHVDALLG